MRFEYEIELEDEFLPALELEEFEDEDEYARH